MLNNLANKLTDLLRERNVITEDEHEIYVYGWELFISTGCNVISILIISAVFNNLLNSIIYLLCFLSIRAYAGGFHASSYMQCYIRTMAYYILPLLLFQVYGTGNLIYIFVLGLLGVAIICLRAPRDHPNRRLSDKETPVYRKRSIALTTIWMAISVCFLLFFDLTSVSWWISIAIAEVGIMLVKKAS